MLGTRRYYKMMLGRRAFCYPPVHRPTHGGESTFALIKPDGMNHLPAIFDVVHEEGFYIRNLKMTQFTAPVLKVLYSDHSHEDYYERFKEFMISGPVIGMKLGRLDALAHWRKVIGPTDSEVAREEAPKSIRALYGTDGRKNCVHGADSAESVVREVAFFFGPKTLMKRLPSVYPNTILLLTPNFLQKGHLGSVIEQIQDADCQINAMEMFSAESLADVKRKLGPENDFKVIKQNIQTGNALLLEVSHKRGYDRLLEEMLRIENTFGTGFTHFDKGNEKLSDKVFT